MLTGPRKADSLMGVDNLPENSEGQSMHGLPFAMFQPGFATSEVCRNNLLRLPDEEAVTVKFARLREGYFFILNPKRLFF